MAHDKAAVADNDEGEDATGSASPSSSTSSLAHDVKAISLQSPPQPPTSKSTDEELARFRRQWQEEVQQHRRKRSDEVPGSGSGDVDQSKADNDKAQHAGPSSYANASSSKHLTSLPSASARDSLGTPIRLMRRAVHAYATAVASERRGNLDEALLHYRKAFKLDAHADQLYDRASRALQHELDLGIDAATDPEAAAAAGIRREMLIETADVRERIGAALDVEDYRFRAIKERQQRETERLAHGGDTGDAASNKVPSEQQHLLPVTESINQRDGLWRLIDKIINDPEEGKPDLMHSRLQPADEDAPMPLERLPDEILQHIIMLIAEPRGRRGAKIVKPALPGTAAAAGTTSASASATTATKETKDSSTPAVGIGMVLAGADYVSVEQLARTCWKFRLLTRARSVWQMIVQETFFSPQLPARTTLMQLHERYDRDWRTAFIEQPRVRLNGTYIAAYHYTRPGEHQENVWVRVIHVVEFYRSLRFLPDGRVLSLLTTDAPSETVRRMDPAAMRGVKGFGVGRWSLHPDGLADDEVNGRPHGAKIVVDDLADKTLAGYTFRLILRLDGGRRGRWDRIDMLEYESVNLKTGEVCPLPMNHKKPFHFSLVRSYGM